MADFYHYPNCDGCRKAVRWLHAHGVEVHKVHLVEQTPDQATLERLWQSSGLPLKKFFNTAGGSYRALNMKDRYDTLSDDERLALLAADGMLIKRPILDLGDTVLVGFKADAYAAALS